MEDKSIVCTELCEGAFMDCGNCRHAKNRGMEENIKLAIEWLKEQKIQGCITGSCLLGYFEGQDVDCFVYSEKSFNKLIFAMYHNPMFQILDPLEKWKFERYINKSYDNYHKIGLLTLKFTYNTCIPVNIVLKKSFNNIFGILSSFDIDIITKGYDIETKKYLDLSENNGTKKCTWNKWNTAFYDPEMWEINRLLRQLERVFKYHKRGYNVDEVVLKYISLIHEIQSLNDIFNSANYSEKLKINKENTEVIEKICTLWLKTHEITDKQLELLKIKIREL